MNFNKKDLRSAQDTPFFDHERDTLDKLVNAEDRLLSLEKHLKQRLLYGDVSRGDKIYGRLAKLLGKQEPSEVPQMSTKKLQEEIEEEIKGDEYLQALHSHKYSNVSKAVRDYHAIGHSLEEVEAIQSELEAMISRDDTVGSYLRMSLDEVKSTADLLKSDKETLLASSPESYYVGSLIHLRELKKQALSGSIIETTSVHAKRRQIESFALAGRPIFLHGAPGTGKTEMAMHVANHLPTAKTYIDKARYESRGDAQPFMIISASKQTDSSELTGHQIINVKQMPDDERKAFTQAIEAEMGAWLEKNKDATEEQKNRQQQIILEAYKLTHGQGMETSFWTGPMYKCMEEGIPFIVDEANAMPPDVLIKINHLMTRRPGNKVIVQEDSGKEITIKEGFCFIFTGNIGEQFQGRYRLEQSFVNRIGDAMIEYDYIPEDELTEVLFAYLMESNKGKGSIVMSPSDMNQVLLFARATCFAQKVFAGKEDMDISDENGGSLSVRDHKLLKNTPLSMRNIFNIVESFKRDNQTKPFEYYVYDAFLKPIQDQGERYTYYKIFEAGGMFAGAGHNLRRDTSGKVIEFGLFDDSPLISKDDKYHVFTPRDVVDKIYGPYARDIPLEDIKNANDNGQSLVQERDYGKVAFKGSPELNMEDLEMNNLVLDIENEADILSRYIQEQEALVGNICPVN
jgi:MoxR-like ATPase